MSEFATRAEVNGLGQRVNQAEQRIAGLHEADSTGKQDRRDIWSAIQDGREEDKRIERLVHQIAVKFAGIQTIFLIVNAVIVALIVKFVTK